MAGKPGLGLVSEPTGSNHLHCIAPPLGRISTSGKAARERSAWIWKNTPLFLVFRLVDLELLTFSNPKSDLFEALFQVMISLNLHMRSDVLINHEVASVRRKLVHVTRLYWSFRGTISQGNDVCGRNRSHQIKRIYEIGIVPIFRYLLKEKERIKSKKQKRRIHEKERILSKVSNSELRTNGAVGGILRD